jgi:hypothetical protein
MILTWTLRGFVTAAIVMVVIISETHAHSFQAKSLRDLYNDADVVVALTVDSATVHEVGAKPCGVAYIGHADRVLKGHRFVTSGRFRFGRSISLIPGHRYLLFLRKTGSLNEEYDRLASLYPQEAAAGRKDDLIRKVSCGGIVPGFLFDDVAAWRIEKGDLFAFALWPRSSIAPAIKIDAAHNPYWLLQERSVFRYLDGLRH